MAKQMNHFADTSWELTDILSSYTSSKMFLSLSSSIGNLKHVPFEGSFGKFYVAFSEACTSEKPVKCDTLTIRVMDGKIILFTQNGEEFHLPAEETFLMVTGVANRMRLDTSRVY